jgi:hypothetical protein
MDHPARSQRRPPVLLPVRLLPQPLGHCPPVLLHGPPAKPLVGPAARLRVRGAGSVCCPLPLRSGRPPPLRCVRPAGLHTRPSPMSSMSAPVSIPRQAHAALHRLDAPDQPATALVLNVCPGLHPRCPASPSLLRCPLHICFLNLSIYE